MDAFGEQSEPNGLGEVDTPLIVITIGRLSPETPMADVHLHTADRPGAVLANSTATGPRLQVR